MMVAVVDAGTGRRPPSTGYTVAGKTGTARKPQANGTYQDAAGNYHYVTTFAGFVPGRGPAAVDHRGDRRAVEQRSTPPPVAAPVFAELARYGLRQFRIPPPAQPLVSTVPAPDVAEEPIVVAEPAAGPVRSEPTVATTTTTTTTCPPRPTPPSRRHAAHRRHEHARSQPVSGRMRTLEQLLDDAGLATAPGWRAPTRPTVEVTDVVLDSRAVRPGALFCCVPGQRVDGHDFAARRRRRRRRGPAGRAARSTVPEGVAVVTVADVRAADGARRRGPLGPPVARS